MMGRSCSRLSPDHISDGLEATLSLNECAQNVFPGAFCEEPISEEEEEPRSCSHLKVASSLTHLDLNTLDRDVNPSSGDATNAHGILTHTSMSESLPESTGEEDPHQGQENKYLPGLLRSNAEVDSEELEESSLEEKMDATSKPLESSATAQSERTRSSHEAQPEQTPFPTICLSPAQKVVLEKVKAGENVFFTGSAGTGKSILLREIIRTLKPLRNVFVTASTGIAAVNIGGTTLHSFAGIGLGKAPAETMIIKIRKNLKSVLERWQKVDTLIIDEVSMLDGSLFDKLEFMARELRGCSKPFGGIQLVISGDFCQLPPVPDRLNGTQVPVVFAFDARSWDRCVGEPVFLNRIFRQRQQKFINMLNDMRFGHLSDEVVNEFVKLERAVVYDDGIEPTELFPLRAEVERANSQRLEKLEGPSHRYLATDVPGVDSNGRRLDLKKAEAILERLIAPKEITLKVGAQVMLIKNVVQGHLVNGSLGVVIDFRTTAAAQQSHTEVAKVDNDKPSQMQASPMSPINNTRLWPVVRFANGQELLCVPAEFSVVDSRGEVEAKRDQVPLILAWALSVHKSQGQTLERVRVDLGRTFEKGQAYVALSRATSLDSLQVLKFHRSKVMTHPRVLAWNEEMQNKSALEESNKILEEMDNKDAVEAFFSNSDLEDM